VHNYLLIQALIFGLASVWTAWRSPVDSAWAFWTMWLLAFAGMVCVILSVGYVGK
jgi:hypothetical protein